jgi:hypothetical protein
VPIGTEQYSTHDLSTLQRELLYRAAREVVDRYFEDLHLLRQPDVTFEDTSMADDLPRKHLRRYNRSFARHFLVCTVAVAQKIREPGLHFLACTAEELALHAIINEAEGLALAEAEIEAAEGRQEAAAEAERAASFSEFRAAAYEDWDFEMLFDGAYDGVEDSTDPRADVVNLHFADWFTPFRDDVVIHPYLDEGQSDTSELAAPPRDEFDDEEEASA